MNSNDLVADSARRAELVDERREREPDDQCRTRDDDHPEDRVADADLVLALGEQPLEVVQADEVLTASILEAQHERVDRWVDEIEAEQRHRRPDEQERPDRVRRRSRQPADQPVEGPVETPHAECRHEDRDEDLERLVGVVVLQVPEREVEHHHDDRDDERRGDRQRASSHPPRFADRFHRLGRFDIAVIDQQRLAHAISPSSRRTSTTVLLTSPTLDERGAAHWGPPLATSCPSGGQLGHVASTRSATSWLEALRDQSTMASQKVP
jgi:hypothetical protein